jgi:hypothetical protein
MRNQRRRHVGGIYYLFLFQNNRLERSRAKTAFPLRKITLRRSHICRNYAPERSSSGGLELRRSKFLCGKIPLLREIRG